MSCQQLYRLLVYVFALAFNGIVNPPLVLSVILLFLGPKYFGTILYIVTNHVERSTCAVRRACDTQIDGIRGHGGPS